MMANLAPNSTRAVTRNIRVAPSKLNLVAQMIAGMDVEQAMQTLTFTRQRIADNVRRTLMSAVANAENNHGYDADRLFVSAVYVGKALVMKRLRARARGRASRIVKPFSNLTIVVSQKEPSITATTPAKTLTAQSKSPS